MKQAANISERQDPRQDIWNLEHIQHSMLSPNYTGPKCSYHEKRIYYLEQTVDKCIGRERVPEHLRVEPLLEDYIADQPDMV